MGIMSELKIGNSQPRNLRKQCGNILDDKIMGPYKDRDDFMRDVKTFCDLLNKTCSVMQITMFFMQGDVPLDSENIPITHIAKRF